MFTGFIKCDCNGVCIEVDPFICTTSTSTSTTTTTTTTTTAACNRWEYSFDILTCESCEFVESVQFYNSNPLTLFNFYQVGSLILSPYEYLGCDRGISFLFISDSGFVTCEEIDCPTITTTTTSKPIICQEYELQAIAVGASWSALNCLGESVGGLIPTGGTTINTGCIDSDTLDIINGEIKNIIPC